MIDLDSLLVQQGYYMLVTLDLPYFELGVISKIIGGEFILRIDDTDKERSKKEYEVKILKKIYLGLELTWDKTFNQSDRQNIYDKKIQRTKG